MVETSKIIWVREDRVITMRRLKGGFVEEVAITLDFWTNRILAG